MDVKTLVIENTLVMLQAKLFLKYLAALPSLYLLMRLNLLYQIIK